MLLRAEVELLFTAECHRVDGPWFVHSPAMGVRALPTVSLLGTAPP